MTGVMVMAAVEGPPLIPRPSRRRPPPVYEVVGKPIGRVREVLVAEHFLGEGAYGLHVLFRRGHAAFVGSWPAVRAVTKASWRHCRKLSGRVELQHMVDGEVASAVSGSCVGRVAELGPELSRGLVVACAAAAHRRDSATRTRGPSDRPVRRTHRPGRFRSLHLLTGPPDGGREAQTPRSDAR